ncbi:hypothetical protein C8N29_102247 [Agitococcus lubricus]|uniref:Uncharacterized protein n=1 Tax=Agitococcus lubricus TaxID=1077255 RepID=A0A2T5J316_9GAMM|nr:hypothetical protein C8N29_102247 [Agitococcus lubricus]
MQLLRDYVADLEQAVSQYFMILAEGDTPESWG